VEDHIEHALGFARAVGDDIPSRALDLGSGGGVPGLVLAVTWPESAWVLLDGQARRVAFLARAITRLGLADRVEALHARAEEAGRDPDLRGAFDLVTSRSFGAPPVVAECAAPLLRVGGRLVVSEPPESSGERWPAAPLADLGLVNERTIGGAATYTVLRQASPAPERYPRRPGIPERRPLF
jgi:16S rRNA (guanine527-N7)-methyltransferase